VGDGEDQNGGLTYRAVAEDDINLDVTRFANDEKEEKGNMSKQNDALGPKGAKDLGVILTQLHMVRCLDWKNNP